MALTTGEYLTDGVSLFRFEGFLPDGEGAILEDAATNRTWSIPLSDFSHMRLKQVKPLQKGTDGKRRTAAATS